MPAKLTTTLAKIPSLQNKENAAVLTNSIRYFELLKDGLSSNSSGFKPVEDMSYTFAKGS